MKPGTPADALSLSEGRSRTRTGTRPPKGLRSAGFLMSLIPVVTFFLIWEAVSRANGLFHWFNPLFLPAPTAILLDGWALAQKGLIIQSVVASTLRITVGFLTGCSAAVLCGILMSRSRTVETWLGPIFNMLGPIPALALLPIFIIWFGIGEFPKILLIAWTTFIPVLAYTLDGFKSVPPTLIRSALSLGASGRHIFTRVMLPSALPNIFVGANVSLGLSFSSLIVSEMMGAKSGLGYIIVDARNYFKMSNMFVAIVLIGLEFSLFAFLLKILEKRLLVWRTNGVRTAVDTGKE
ncbi:MAG: ABC transporter permease [Alicyclobacillaceae bacterium]|nr:ABC transporter permease [Alicyclobacillaceae bacterium]